MGAHKWTWWFLAFAFAILITIHLAKMVMAENVSLVCLLSLSDSACLSEGLCVTGWE